jgi:hypothetical protein
MFPMFPNWSGWKSIKALLFTCVTFNAVFMLAGTFSPETVKASTIASLFFGAAGTVVTTLSGTAAGTPATIAMAKRVGLVAAAACVLLVALPMALGACSGGTSPTVTKVETVTIDSTVCILTHFSDPPATIAAECGLATVEDVVKVLSAHKAAMARELADAGSVRP